MYSNKFLSHTWHAVETAVQHFFQNIARQGSILGSVVLGLQKWAFLEAIEHCVHSILGGAAHHSAICAQIQSAGELPCSQLRIAASNATFVCPGCVSHLVVGCLSMLHLLLP